MYETIYLPLYEILYLPLYENIVPKISLNCCNLNCFHFSVSGVSTKMTLVEDAVGLQHLLSDWTYEQIFENLSHLEQNPKRTAIVIDRYFREKDRTVLQADIERDALSIKKVFPTFSKATIIGYLNSYASQKERVDIVLRILVEKCDLKRKCPINSKIPLKRSNKITNQTSAVVEGKIFSYFVFLIGIIALHVPVLLYDQARELNARNMNFSFIHSFINIDVYRDYEFNHFGLNSLFLFMKEVTENFQIYEKWL